MPDLREKRVELILQSMEQLPTLPAIAVRVIEATASDETNAADIVRLIESDPALTARILQLVHRSDLGISADLTSVARAVTLLGFDAIRTAVLSLSIFETFQQTAKPPTGDASAGFSRDAFWKHCVATACCAELLAAALPHGGGVSPADAFVCGLLHDMGKVALDAVLPKSFSRVIEAVELLRGNIADLERTIVGLDHMVVGKRLAERWALPASIRECIWLHGQLPQALPATVQNGRLVNLITLADMLVRAQHLGFSGNYLFPVPKNLLLEAIGLSAEQVDDAMARLVNHIEPRAAALGLGQATSGELYQQALSRANVELGKVSSQLATRNKKLAVRAKFFDALSGFQSEMRPDSPPPKVLEAIGLTALTVLDVNSVAVFSLMPGKNFAETVVVDSAGELVEPTIVDFDTTSADTDRPRPPAAGEGPVLSIDNELEWLLSAVGPRLANVHRFWVCLESDGQCIGGVLWGAAQGESQRLGTQVQELTALAAGWSLALRTAQIREESRDLAEQLAEANRRLQNVQGELLRSRTLVSVGEMAAGAAHEMNNPLAVISGRSQLLSMQLTDPKQKAAAALIFEQSHRVSQIITELMDFARPTKPNVTNCSVAELVSDAVSQAKADPDSADRTVDIHVRDVPAVTVDKEQVTAALMEIIANAFAATDSKEAVTEVRGDDTGETGGEPAGQNGGVNGGVNGDAARFFGYVSIHAAFDPYSMRVVLTVADDGSGMDEATVKRAFDPFFSAKHAGRRRGMGLAKALRWVEGSGGSIRLESRPGQGTRAAVLLPTARAQSVPTREADAAAG